MSQLRQFSKTALLQHAAAHPDKTFISIHENVYDVTEFLDEHPGGEEALKEHQIKNQQFKDATESFEDVGHSMDARDMMGKFQVGVLEGKRDKTAKKPETKTDEANRSTSWSVYLIPLALLGVVLAYQYFAHHKQ